MEIDTGSDLNSGAGDGEKSHGAFMLNLYPDVLCIQGTKLLHVRNEKFRT